MLKFLLILLVLLVLFGLAGRNDYNQEVKKDEINEKR